MRRLFAISMCLLLALMLGLGSVAHASEPVEGIEISAASSLFHVEGDSDQVPADSDKNYPHHHGECSGHHVGVPTASAALRPSAVRPTQPRPGDHHLTAGVAADLAPRPPQA